MLGLGVNIQSGVTAAMAMGAAGLADPGLRRDSNDETSCWEERLRPLAGG